MKVGEVLAMYEQVQHVEALPADLKTGLDPVDGCLLEELG